jgi:hypothetical protein
MFMAQAEMVKNWVEYYFNQDIDVYSFDSANTWVAPPAPSRRYREKLGIME